MNNSFGNILRLTTFGESHGPALGGIIDGFPAGIEIDLDEVQHQLDRRRPGQSRIVTSRNEKDQVEILSGIFEGRTTGQPIGFIVKNTNQHSNDYNNMRSTFRPSHADFTFTEKYGLRDHRGGGRSSARETLSRVVGGAFARQALEKLGITITAYTSAVGPLTLGKPYSAYDLSVAESNPVRCPDSELASEMEKFILQIKGEGDTVGGIVSCVVRGCPVGLGDPVFGKLQARLAAAMMSINAAKGFEYGMGFEGTQHRGSEMIDPFTTSNGRITTTENHSGGIQGGISNGADIYFSVGFKPVATLLRDIETVDYDGNPTVIHTRGRHDPCVVPRAVPIVEAMAAMVLLDCYLKNKTVRL